MPPKRTAGGLKATSNSKTGSQNTKTNNRSRTKTNNKNGNIKSKGKSSNTSIPVISPPPSQSNVIGRSSQSSQTGSQKHHFGRQNRLDDLFSSQQSAPSQTQTQTKGSKSARTSMFEEDEGFIYKRMEPQDKLSNKKKLSTPVSRLNEALDELPGNDFDDSFDSIDFDLRSARDRNGPSPKRQKTNRSRQQYEYEPEVIKLSSPIRPRYEAEINPKKSRSGYRNNEDTSSDDYIEQVSHHKLDLTGGEDDFINSENDNNSTISKSRILRNKNNLRNQNNDRRSSYNNRGKRILSIGNGFVGLPHEDVSAKDYYKLLDTSLPEPHRMRQLLIWCINKQINNDEICQSKSKAKFNKASDNNQPEQNDQTVINIAKVIKEEVLQDLRDGQINTSWYYKPNDDDDDDNVDKNNNNNKQNIIANKEIVLPNPLNITTQNNIDHFTKELNKLKREKEQWKKLYKKNSNNLKNLNGQIDGKFDKKKDLIKLQQYLKEKRPDLSIQILDETLINSIINNHDELKDKFLGNLEDSIDKLYNFTHRLVKVNEVIDHYKSSKLNPKISEMTRNYINKTKFENFQNIDGSNSLWPLPTKPLGIKQLLKGIAQLDYSMLNSSTNSEQVTSGTINPVNQPPSTGST